MSGFEVLITIIIIVLLVGFLAFGLIFNAHLDWHRAHDREIRALKNDINRLEGKI